MEDMNIKTFPLRVLESWLDEVEEVRTKDETKHSFIILAVNKEIKLRKEAEKNGKTD